jgi:hypothetical protein
MTIQDIHNVILFYLSKEQNGHISHEEIDLVLDRAQMALFDDYYNNPKWNRQSQQMVGYGESQRLNDALSPFKATYTFTNSDSSGGVITLPANYMYLLSLQTTRYSNTLSRNVMSAVTVLNEEELIYRLESQVVPVTLDGPICIMNSSNQIQLFPDTAQAGKVYYFRRPAVPKFGYTQSGRVITYNATQYSSSALTGSQQLEWRESDLNNLITKALSYYGLNLNSPDVAQFAQLKIQEGQ